MPLPSTLVEVLLLRATCTLASEESCLPQLPANAQSSLLQVDLHSSNSKNHVLAASHPKASSSAMLRNRVATTPSTLPEKKTSIRYSGKAKRIPDPKAALYTTLVQPFGKQHWKVKGNDMLLDSLFLYCSARWAGSQLPFHITTSGINSSAMKLLKELGFKVHDFSLLETRVKHDWFKPVYTKQQAREQGRLWIDPVSISRYGVDAEHALNRTDGWATYFKFLAWNRSDFDVLLHVDVDVQFLGNPDTFIWDAARQGEAFLATVETGGRQYRGLNTHMMLLRPSPEVFSALVSKASRGDYVPLTNTEQDVLEWYFDIGNVTRMELTEGFLHTHNSERAAAWKDWLKTSNVPSQCTGASLVQRHFGKNGFTCQQLAEVCQVDNSRRQMYTHPAPDNPKECPRRVAAYSTSRRPRVFIVVPGFGEVKRQDQLKKNMGWLRKQDVDIVCVIYVYASAEKLPLLERDYSPCKIQRQPGYPAQFMLAPPEHHWSNQDYVMIWFDDVAVPPDTDLIRMIKILDHNGLGMLTPSYSEEMFSHWPERHGNIMFHNASEQNAVGRYTSYAELMFTLMTPAAYRCLRSLIDVDVNPFGYGLDRLFPDRCSEHCLGVLDETTMMDESVGTFSYKAAHAYEDAYFSKHGYPRPNRQIVFGTLEDPRFASHRQ